LRGSNLEMIDEPKLEYFSGEQNRDISHGYYSRMQIEYRTE
ncbi:unnamed protein product, partial [marine sediment metagenome]